MALCLQPVNAWAGSLSFQIQWPVTLLLCELHFEVHRWWPSIEHQHTVAARQTPQVRRHFVQKQCQPAGAAAQQKIGQKMLRAFFLSHLKAYWCAIENIWANDLKRTTVWLKGSAVTSSRPHDNVSLSKTLNPKLLLLVKPVFHCSLLPSVCVWMDEWEADCKAF